MKMMIILEYTDAEQIKWLTKIWGQTEEFPEDSAAYPCTDNKINPAPLAPGCMMLPTIASTNSLRVMTWEI